VLSKKRKEGREKGEALENFLNRKKKDSWKRDFRGRTPFSYQGANARKERAETSYGKKGGEGN